MALRIGLVGLAATLFLSVQVKMSAQGDAASAGRSPAISSQRQFLDRYCATCHNERLKTGGLSLDQVDLSRPGAQPELWEKVVRKLHTGVMPPPNMPQPSEADRLAMLTWLETSLDAASAAKPNPGRTETLRRLNRTEYQNAIRDLLALDIDAASLLPADESGHGFDNVNVGDLSPTLLNRYISAAQKISRLAVGSTQSSLQSDTIQPACRSHAGRSVARAADWHARWRVDVLYVCPGRRVRDPDLCSLAIWQESSAGCARPVRTRCWCCSTGSRSQTFTISEASQRRRHAARQGFESAHRRAGRPAQHRASHSSRRAHR